MLGNSLERQKLVKLIHEHSIGNPFVHFLEQIKALDETDYGDFMRKANSYLLNLKEEEVTLAHLALQYKISEIQNYLQFSPDRNIESTRERLLLDADKLIFLDSTSSV